VGIATQSINIANIRQTSRLCPYLVTIASHLYRRKLMVARKLYLVNKEKTG
jgi:hypothetical protein